MSILRQPTAVWATAGAAVVAFMGIGLVDPILPSIAKGLSATPSQVSLLFTSYFLITAVAMLVTGFVSSRIGGRRTLLAGLALVVVFAGLAGTSDSVGQLVGFRAGWGLGNALFVSTSLAVIVGAASGGAAAAILLYESALGLGMACGPLLGAVLGDMKWRYPFFGTAALMAVGFVAIALFLKEQPKPARRTSLLDPLKALGHGGLASAAASAFFYNYAFFTVLAFTPFVLDMSPYRSGAVFFAGGCCSPCSRSSSRRALQAAVRVAQGARRFAACCSPPTWWSSATATTPRPIVCTIVSGALIGVNNTVYTELALGVSDAPRPVASAGYNFVRWFAAAAAPYLAPKIEGWSTSTSRSSSPRSRGMAAAAVIGVRRRRLVVVHGRGRRRLFLRPGRPCPAAAHSPGAQDAPGQRERGTEGRRGSRRSVPWVSQRSWRASAPCTRFQAASFGVIGQQRQKTARPPAARQDRGPRPARPPSATRTAENGAPGHSGSPDVEGVAGGHDDALDLRGRGEYGQRPEHLVGVGAPAAYREQQFGARAPYRIGDARPGGRSWAARTCRAWRSATRSPVGEAEHLDAVGAEEGHRGARVRLAERGAQPRLDQRQNISHTASIERVSNAAKRDGGGRGLAKVERSRMTPAYALDVRASPSGDGRRRWGLTWIRVDRAVPAALPSATP